MKGTTEDECYTMAKDMKKVIDASMVGTPFESVVVDIKGNYKFGLFASRKMYAMTLWDGTEETKGMTPVKKDTLPVARYTAKRILEMVNTSDTLEVKTINVRNFLGKVFRSIEKGKIKAVDQVSQVKINCQPHYVYKSTNGSWTSVLVDEAGSMDDVSPEWVRTRVSSSITNILHAAGLPSIEGMMFSYSMYLDVKRAETDGNRSDVAP